MYGYRSATHRTDSRGRKIIRHDDFAFTKPALIAGADVGFEQGGKVTSATIALLYFPLLELLEYQVARVATTMLYIPGFYRFANIRRCWQHVTSLVVVQIC